ncbi:MAG: nickel pincer cofactor biosynthesis protein LarB [Acidobacteria bacterium]|nr:nickel pincer cofactor biosynthesis protein LarB [Acidobacteriota bacterium]
MDSNQIRTLLEQVKDGGVSVDQAVDKMRHLPFEDLGFAKVDHHRALRSGMPEVIFGQGKTPEQIAGIAQNLLDRSANVLATRVSPEAAAYVLAAIPEAEHFPLSRIVRVWRDREEKGKGTIAVVCAGTADLPVAEECRITAEMMGNKVDAITDVGVAGIHRLFANLDRLRAARVICAVAGMEATLPTAIGGLVSVPIIGVPTSVGYGAHFNGLAALLSMLNSCATGVTVVNIDNGFGAGYVASLINRLP